MTAARLTDRTVRARTVRQMLAQHDRETVERYLVRLGWTALARQRALSDALEPDLVAQLRDAGTDPQPLTWHITPTWQAYCPSCTERYHGRRLIVRAGEPPDVDCKVGCSRDEVLHALHGALLPTEAGS